MKSCFRKRKLKLVSIFILLFYPLIEVFSQINLDKTANFAKSLIDNREYNRALIELERINFIDPSYFNPFQFRVTINYLNFQSRNFDRIVLLQDQDYSQIFAIDSALVLKDYPNAESIINSILHQNFHGEEFADMLERRLLFSNLMQTFPKKINDMSYIDRDVYTTILSPYRGFFSN